MEGVFFEGYNTFFNLQLALKFDFQPSTMKLGSRHPPTVKTGQIWSSADFKNGFLFSNNNKNPIQSIEVRN